jgi:hypothetical protein
MRMTKPQSTLSRNRLKTALILLALLTSCAQKNSSGCPMLKSYTPEQQDKAYVELSQLSSGAELRAMMNDYALLRQEARDCN